MRFATPFPELFKFQRRIVFCIALLSFNLASAQTENAIRPEPLHADGIKNFFRLSEKIYSGSSPESENAFAALQKLGIKTIISVDGAQPDVETAKKFGLRYVHLPFGYDRVPTNQALKLVKTASELPKPIYVHCHHGLHRGPAGAAIICKETENWTHQQALDWLKLAGTTTNYSGLYKSVETFRAPSAGELKRLPNEFPEKIEASPLVDTMVEIDRRFDSLKLILKARANPSAAHLNLGAAHQFLLLEELFKELNRTLPDQNPQLRDKMVEAEKLAHELRLALGANRQHPNEASEAKLTAAFNIVAKSCATCHKAHRN